MLIYVSGKYTAPTVAERAANIQAARKVAGDLWKLGHAVICPHLNTANFEQDFPEIAYDQYINGDLQMIARCDAMVMVLGWEESKGACTEERYAKSLGLPIYYPSTPLPPLHSTEQRCPQQAKRFAELLGRMYRVHLDKNADYSPANILGTGALGVTVRLWDKVARLLSLTGFRLTIAEAGTFDAPREPKNESIDDTLLDAANYAVIAALVREGVWGK